MQSSTLTPSPNGKPETQSKTYKSGAFIRRKPGMPWEEFVNRCVDLFRERGLIQDEPEDWKALPTDTKAERAEKLKAFEAYQGPSRGVQEHRDYQALLHEPTSD